MDSTSASSSSNSPGPSAPAQPDVDQPPTQSAPPPASQSDQLLQVQTILEDVASGKVHLPQELVMGFTLCQDSWHRLQGDPNLELCVGRNELCVAYDASLSLVTIKAGPPLNDMHRIILEFLSDLQRRTRSTFASM
ncbi:uncharacterized protein Z520_11730 [Fonsecaea multimorphosa CBS 102226]|uniref:Uncharacterized protein n=1 Tax=Fonsecaea multimorphosa CBS 102226 TaxID=1442371 RepID=A0A0D2JPX7_9EURO|nr:uncharacterized protein Z520_11730 [Fonsecaea multimorphosa CBS 102226]KIX92554.1 hypothetical protein Z520_11730 [Fonsecaea multimorphosa CBS 102226]OAL17821.1 hypothetical protein AYO22_11248 [Fonsecaea multimorphosa]